jgi:cytochrome c-type biogenesis protein CcmH/NrfG
VRAERRDRVWAAGMAVLVGALLVLVVWRGALLIGSGTAAGAGIGVAVVVIAVVGAWVLWRSVRFGMRMQTLARELQDEGGLPVDDLPRRPSGRAERGAADELFERRRAEAEADPGDWRVWFRLALAYDDAGDRSRAREAARRAIALHG